MTLLIMHKYFTIIWEHQYRHFYSRPTTVLRSTISNLHRQPHTDTGIRSPSPCRCHGNRGC